MHPWAFLILWFFAQALHGFCWLVAFLRSRETEYRRNRWSLWPAGVAGFFPAVTLVLFLVVFVIGGSSNIAQLAGESGGDLWSLWATTWPMLMFGDPASLLVAGAAILLPPYSLRFWPSWLCRISGIVAAGLACYVVCTYFPDA